MLALVVVDAFNHSIVCECEQQSIDIFSCMLYLIVISGNRNREVHQQAVPIAQLFVEAHMND